MNTPEQLAARLTHVGFTEVKVHNEKKAFAYTTLEDWW